MARRKAGDGSVSVRVLVDCQYGACNTVAEIPEGDLEMAKAERMVDDDPAAVAAAEKAAKEA